MPEPYAQQFMTPAERIRRLARCAGFLSCLLGIIRTDRAAEPATAPATTQARARRTVVIPAGFKAVSAAGRTVLCEPGDETWVLEVLTATGPATRPTTMPADLTKSVSEMRASLKTRLVAELALTDPGAVDKLFDEKFLPDFQKLDSLRPPIFYLVCSHDRIKQLLKSGWQDPHFYYNRAADDVAFTPDLPLALEGPIDDMLLPAIYESNAPPERKRDDLAKIVRGTENGVINAVAVRGPFLIQLHLIGFIHEQAIAPLKLRRDQEWFGVGLEAVLSTQYMCEMAGVSPEVLLRRIVNDAPRNPIRAATIDLLHPADPKELRAQYLPAYSEAFRIKSTRAVQELISKGGPGAPGKAIAAIRANPPADGAAMVALIRAATGVDLTNATKPG
ncbi:MAG: hypothetical protein ACREJC_23065 [Tepidisphaeraceae bacterium]